MIRHPAEWDDIVFAAVAGWCDEITDAIETGLPVKRSIALRRIVDGPAVRTASVTGFWRTDRDAALASPAVAVAGCEVDGVDAAVALSAALGADLGDGSPDARAVRAGVTIACAVGGLVMFDLIDVDGDGVAVGVGYALDGDVDHVVIRRPDRGDAGEGPATIRRLVGRREHIRRALLEGEAHPLAPRPARPSHFHAFSRKNS